MNGPVICLPDGGAPAPGRWHALCQAMTTRELLGWVVLLFGGENLARSVSGAAGNGVGHGSWSIIDGIVWGCALLLLWRDGRGRPASRWQLAGILPIIAAAPLLAGNIVYGAVLLIGMIVVRGAGWSPNERRFGMILISIGVCRVLSKLIVMLFADAILRADTALAGILMTAVVPGSTWTANTIHPPHDVGITVAMACSSFANLSLVSLCYTSMALLDGAVLSLRNIIAVGSACLMVIVFNTVRLMLMARSLAAYVYWHDGAGATTFGIILSLVTVAMCSLGSRWANPR